MEVSHAFSHYASRRDLLRGFLDEYHLLAQEQPALVARLSFRAFVHYSFAHYQLGRQQAQCSQVHGELLKLIGR